jgi:hypothetical protein
MSCKTMTNCMSILQAIRYSDQSGARKVGRVCGLRLGVSKGVRRQQGIPDDLADRLIPLPEV